MRIRELKLHLLLSIGDAVEIPSKSSDNHTKREMWHFYNDLCDREFIKNNSNMIIAETLKEKILKDFPHLKKRGGIDETKKNDSNEECSGCSSQ